MTTYYRNEYLFSEIYLQEITQQPEDTEILASLTTLKEYREWARTATIQEWKDSFVHEVLYALRFGVKPENERLTLLYPVGPTETPLTLCYVLLPTEDLDNTTMGQNWAEKVIRSLRHHNLKWGLLTNGEKWRIYHLDESTPYEIFLEMNLAAILSDSASQDYQIFHKFMKVEIFTKDEQGQCRLDMFKKESLAKIDYIESELANALKQKEEGGKGVLSNLCMGYVEFLKASGNPNLDDDALRRKIYHGAMLYMFRLLFLFYADARSLLNETNSRLLKDVLQRSKAASPNDTSASNYSIWEDLESIFVDIDQSYNGGLFDPHESEFTQFIEESRVNDAYLASAVHYLTSYQERSREEKAISYRDMSVRHLGTLYEGLLEHKLFIAKEDTQVRTAKDKIQFIPASQGGRIVAGHYITAGQVYFGSDRSERKATGSFYTPEYIVDYIVRNTVGEKLSQLRQDFLAEQKDLLSAVGKAIDQKERKALTELLEDDLKTFIKEKVLKLSVLDPAMGSGHFLVNTSNCIANFITEILNEFEIIGTTETSTTYWRRWVVENCVYGVDVNPLAVELAKLSLWILSMSKEKPLSFLNHNLKTGNSLIGAHLDDIGKYPGKEDQKQLSIFSDDHDFKEAVGKAISNYIRITSIDSASLDIIADKKAWLDEIDDILKPYKLICDVHTGIYFGNEISEWKYKELIGKKDIDHSNNVALSYFHWELEFPNMLLREQGFDCYIGNPPYIQIKAIPEKNRQFFKNVFRFATGRYNIFYFFIEQSGQLTKHGGLSSLIVPDRLLLNTQLKDLRQWLLDDTEIQEIVSFDESVFDTAVVDSIILIYQMIKRRSGYMRAKYKVSPNELSQLASVKIPVSYIKLTPSTQFHLNFNIAKYRLLEKIGSRAILLEEISDTKDGIIQGKVKDELFLNEPLDQDSKPLLFGENIKRYKITFDNNWVNYKPDQMMELELIRRGDGVRHGLWLRNPAVFERPKILTRQTADEIIAAFDDEDHYYANTLHGTSITDLNYNFHYVLGVLNSKLTTWLYRSNTDEEGKVFAQIKIELLRKLPIPKADERDQQRIIEIVTRIIALKLGNDIVNTSKDEREIDNIVYELYDLTDEEINIVEGNVRK